MKLPVRIVYACALTVILGGCDPDPEEKTSTGLAEPSAPAEKAVVNLTPPATGQQDDSLAKDVVIPKLRDTAVEEKSFPDQEAYLEQQDHLNKLWDPSPAARVEAAKKIEPVGEALEVLLELIKDDPSPEVRIATTWSLENSEDPRAMEALILGLKDKNDEVVLEMIQSLRFAGDDSTVKHLEPSLKHPNQQIRKAAADAIELLE